MSTVQDFEFNLELKIGISICESRAREVTRPVSRPHHTNSITIKKLKILVVLFWQRSECLFLSSFHGSAGNFSKRAGHINAGQCTDSWW